MKAIFIFGAAAVCASATPAGTMASRNGSATAAPTPRRTARRERYFLVRKIMSYPLAHSVRYRHLGDLHIRLTATRNGRHLLHLEGGACDDPEQDRGKAIVVGGRIAHDLTNGRHVVIVQCAAE